MMMKIAQKEIYLLPAGRMIDAADNDFYILYAPLSQDICFIEARDAEALRAALEQGTAIADDGLKELADSLAAAGAVPAAPLPHPRQTERMSLMPNYTCNFSCSYCYSAKGRSAKQIEWAKAKAALDYFIDTDRIAVSQPLSLFISGGGEPLLSWDVVSRAIDYARERAGQQGFTLRISLITNGSLMTVEKAEWLKKRHCDVCVSFEVLEDLQNGQRSHYGKVCQALHLLDKAEVSTMINATITQVSVGRMVEMTAEVIKSYPFVRQFTMEPVTSVSLFPSADSLRQFYDTFIAQYIEAKRLARRHGLRLRFAMDEALEDTVVRHCPGKFCLTAEGTFTACHLATSPKEERYAKCVYGKVTDEGCVEIDDDKFQQIFNDNMLARHRCDDCFARWNCGGECMARNDTYPREYMEEVCHFNRQWLTYLLKEQLDEETMTMQGITLREAVLQSETEALRRHEVFAIPADNGQWMLYAPLADSAALLAFDDMRRLGSVAMSREKGSGACTTDEEAEQLFDDLTDVTPVDEREGYVRSVNDFINLSILPNNVCNFSCDYCYSAKGRSKQRLTYTKAKAAADFFLSPERNDSPRLTVSIFGGGEPLLSWNDVVRPLIMYLYDKAKEQHRCIDVTIITNGSILADGFTDICRSYHIDLVVSYEVLRDVQDSQRGHYDLVTDNIRKLIDSGIIPAINTVVTPLNVTKIEEIVEQLHSMFPEIVYLSAEPAKDLPMADRREFYRQFTDHFMQAREKAETWGIQLTCSALRKVDQTIERYCAGEMALCADGALSVCPCVSSPAAPHYDTYVYGRVGDDGTVTIDQQRLAQLLAVNVHTHPWCAACFAKWNCAGGCMHSNNKNGGQQDADFCWFTREMTRRLILQRLAQEQE